MTPAQRLQREDFYAPLPVRFFRHPKTKAARAADHAAPEAFLVLLAEAEAQHRAGGPFGEVRMAWDDFLLCVGQPTANVNHAAHLLGVLVAADWVVRIDADDFGFRVALPNMGEWSQRDTTARVKEHRASLNAEAAGDEPSRFTPEHTRLSHLLADLIREQHPKAKVAPDAVSWLNPIRLLCERDQRDAAEIEKVIRWCQRPECMFVVMSAGALREKFDRLVAGMGKERARGGGPQSSDADFRARMGAQ